jgi:hypothetical protein
MGEWLEKGHSAQTARSLMAEVLTDDHTACPMEMPTVPPNVLEKSRQLILEISRGNGGHTARK